MIYIGDELNPKTIRVTKGADRRFTLRRCNLLGELLDWDADVYLNIDIDPDAPTRVAATVEGPLARVLIESDIADQVRDTTTWQVIRSEPDIVDTDTLPLMVGTFDRQDGKPE